MFVLYYFLKVGMRSLILKIKEKKKKNIRVTPETFLLFGPKIWGYEDDDTVIVIWNSY